MPFPFIFSWVLKCVSLVQNIESNFLFTSEVHNVFVKGGFCDLIKSTLLHTASSAAPQIPLCQRMLGARTQDSSESDFGIGCQTLYTYTKKPRMAGRGPTHTVSLTMAPGTC
jgi:hypothetical protein